MFLLLYCFFLLYCVFVVVLCFCFQSDVFFHCVAFLFGYQPVVSFLKVPSLPNVHVFVYLVRSDIDMVESFVLHICIFFVLDLECNFMIR